MSTNCPRYTLLTSTAVLDREYRPADPADHHLVRGLYENSVVICEGLTATLSFVLVWLLRSWLFGTGVAQSWKRLILISYNHEQAVILTLVHATKTLFCGGKPYRSLGAHIK